MGTLLLDGAVTDLALCPRHAYAVWTDYDVDRFDREVRHLAAVSLTTGAGRSNALPPSAWSNHSIEAGPDGLVYVDGEFGVSAFTFGRAVRSRHRWRWESREPVTELLLS